MDRRSPAGRGSSKLRPRGGAAAIGSPLCSPAMTRPPPPPSSGALVQACCTRGTCARRGFAAGRTWLSPRSGMSASGLPGAAPRLDPQRPFVDCSRGPCRLGAPSWFAPTRRCTPRGLCMQLDAPRGVDISPHGKVVRIARLTPCRAGMAGRRCAACLAILRFSLSVQRSPPFALHLPPAQQRSNRESPARVHRPPPLPSSRLD